jgi:diguanylate cyclase (GGDEF)-like protein/PAS domain S-box-containing protein
MTASLNQTAGKYSTAELKTILAIHAIAIDEMAHGICVFDSELRIVLFNRRFVEILGIRHNNKVSTGVSIGSIFEQAEQSTSAPHIASAQMWHEIEETLLLGEPFRLHRTFSKDVTIAFHFQPTKGGGWVLTCDRLPDAAKNEIPNQPELLRRVIQHASNGICVFDPYRRLTICNDQYLQIYGYDRTLIKNGVSFKSVLENAFERRVYAASTFDALHDELDALFQNKGGSCRSYLCDGRIIEVRVLPVETGGWLTEHEDITQQVRYEQALKERNQLLDAALDHMAHGLCAYDAQFRVIVVNRRYLEIYGLTPDEASAGTPMIELMRRSIARGIHSPGVDAEQMFADLKERLIENKEPVLVRHLADGRVIAVRHQPMTGGGWVGTYEDITERFQVEKNISRMARHDALTELPNRLLFRENMIDGLTHVIEKGKRMAVMCFDLDNFKGINDSLGHPFGDKLLQSMADRLRTVIAEGDTLARLGGDEFAILHPTSGTQDTLELARRLISATSIPFLIDGQEINSSICVGIAMAPENGTTGDELMKRADLALYRAKALGRGTLHFFDPDMDLQIQARRALEVDLHRALASGEFEIAYQPQLNLATNDIIGMEALARWTHPERGAVPPSEFIPIAEETGLIVLLGEWVLRQACTEAARWPASIRLAVNLSPVQFRNRALVSTITNALAAARLPAERLELEITEAILMQKDEAIVSMLHQLRSLGIRITMDDFGTGYSSLSYLRSFPFDKIKIDKSFVAGIGSSDGATAIVRTIAALGSAMGIETTAEGIETQEQLALVRAAGCTEAQGYLIGRPSTALDALQRIRQATAPNLPVWKSIDAA